MDEFLTPPPPPEACVENPVMPSDSVMAGSPVLMPRPKRRLPKAPAKAVAAPLPKRPLPKAPAKVVAACPPPKAKASGSAVGALGATIWPKGEGLVFISGLFAVWCFFLNIDHPYINMWTTLIRCKDICIYELFLVYVETKHFSCISTYYVYIYIYRY